MRYSPRLALTLFLSLGSLGACVADRADTGPMVDDLDLVMMLSIADVAGIELSIDGGMPAGRAPRAQLSPSGNVEVLYVDLDRGVKVAEGFLDVSHVVVEESFDEHGIHGEPVDLAVVRRQLVLPAPGRGHGRLTVRRGEEVVAFEITPEGAEQTLSVREAAADPLDRTLPSADEEASSDAVGAAREALSSGTCGDGERARDETPLDFDGIFTLKLYGEQCDDGNNESGDGCSADCRNELVHIAGNEDPTRAFTIVFVPGGWATMSDFIAFAEAATQDTLDAHWYEGRPNRFSFWALDRKRVNRWGDVACGSNGPIGERFERVTNNELAGASFGGREHTPDRIVFAHARECRAFSFFGGNISLGSDDGEGNVLAHELGHSLGHLADEYAFGGGDSGKSCQKGPNIGHVDDQAWQCSASGPLSCAAGPSVALREVGGTCGTEAVVQCARCTMSVNDHEFCPVCRATMNSRLRHHLGLPIEEVCGNAADDDLDGEADEGCSCEPGGSEPEWAPCEVTSCVDDIGTEICAGDDGVVELEPGLLASCVCTASGGFDCE